MKKIIEYIIIEDHDSLCLGERINEYIEEGWQPYGSPFSANESSSGSITYSICQAMVKYEDV